MLFRKKYFSFKALPHTLVCCPIFYPSLHRIIRPEVFCKKDLLKNFAKFTGKHLHRSLSCEFCEYFKKTFMLNNTSVCGCFCQYNQFFKRFSVREKVSKNSLAATNDMKVC